MIGMMNPPQIELQPGQRFFCMWPWETVTLTSDGTIVCGCADPYKQRPAGNAGLLTIREIWNGPVFQELRRGMQTNNPHLCTHCNLIGVTSDPNQQHPAESKLNYLPRRLFVEPCVSCNLSCYQACCNHENGIHFTRSTRLLEYDTYTKIIDELGPTLQRIDFFNYGESFIHPKAIDMIQYAKSRYPHVYLFTSTNGLLLNTDDKLRRLVESGIDEITFSVDGARQDSYVKYRRGGDFNKVFQIMKRLVEIRKELKSDTPFTNWRYILFRWNDSEEEMQMARSLAAEIDVDRLCWEITDHPENSASERFVAGTADYQRIQHEIWDRALGNAIPHKNLQAAIQPLDSTWKAKAGEPFEGRVDLRNSGGGIWKNTSLTNRRHITLGLQLMDSKRNMLNRDFARAILPKPLASGESYRLALSAKAPLQPGNYWIKLDMVCEGFEWFESCGSQPAYTRLQVH